VKLPTCGYVYLYLTVMLSEKEKHCCAWFIACKRRVICVWFRAAEQKAAGAETSSECVSFH